ncbi:GNAT family N-acetyltransferase [Bacillus infantis]|uniref:GNAT family N-acetyltransferase n=1 Tax=Bacillus infantis TaxID=324767 RepID=UPI003CF81C8C
MDEVFKSLKKAGIHYIKNDQEFILEMFEDKINNPHEADTAIKKLITNLTAFKERRILFECPRTVLDQLMFTKRKMVMTGERVIYTREFTEPINQPPAGYEVWSIQHEESIALLSEVMGRSFNDTRRFLTGMQTELPSQVNNMYTVLMIADEPAGVVFPHLEPDSDRQGRLFWIGMHPKFLGKGLGQRLHLLGLYRLRNEFKANSYLGATKIDNTPMRKIMIANGCTQNKNTVLSLEYNL